MEKRVPKMASPRTASTSARGIVPRIAGVLRAALVAMAMLLAVACSRPDPEVQLRETVSQLQAAIEERDPAAMQQHLADDFVGNDGLDRDAARRLAAAYVLRHRDIGLTLGPLDAQVQATHATVRFTAVLRGGSGRMLPDAAQVYEVETGWRLEDDEWKLVSARWTP